MSSPISSEFSDIVAPSSDERGGLSPFLVDPSGNSTIDPELPIGMLPAVESFIPIIEQLPGLVLENNTYYIGGRLGEADLEQLVSYTRRISELILTDTLPTSRPDIAPETLARLALIHDFKSPFLPSLECLRLIDATQSLSYLFFCISPSLKTLEIVATALTRQTTISSFLKELVLRAPELSNITLRGRVSEISLQSSLKFNYLRELYLIDAAESLDFAFLQDISALPELASLIIDARMAEYKQHLVSTDNASLASATDDNEASTLSSSAEDQTTIATIPETIPFRRLRKLAITSNVVLMEDLIFYLSPRAVKEVSLILVQPCLPELPPNIGHIGMSIEELKWILDQHPTSKRSPAGVSRKIFRTIDGTEIKLTLAEERRYRDYLAAYLDKREREQERESAISKTLFFAAVIEKILAFGAVDSFIIDHEDMSSQTAFTETEIVTSPLEFSPTTFEMLLSYPTLKELKITHWALPSIEKSIINATTTQTNLPMSMQKLQFPVDKASNPGIAVSTLDLIARYYPRLIYFECFIQTPSEATLHLDLGTDIISHQLEVLSVGGGLPSLQDKITVAAYLSLLFPNLKDINTHKGYSEDDWKYIHTLITMCHSVSLATEKRLHRATH